MKEIDFCSKNTKSLKSTFHTGEALEEEVWRMMREQFLNYFLKEKLN